MKDYQYIDKIVKETIEEMQVPVNSTWKDITERIKNTPQEPANVNNSFLSTLTSKIIAGIFAVVAAISGFLWFNNKNSVSTVNAPQNTTYEITTTRKVKVIEQNPVIENNTYQRISHNDTQISDNVDNNTTTVITIEKTKIDTLE